MEQTRTDLKQHLYWLEKAYFEWAKDLLPREGCQLTAMVLTPCQVLKASGRKVVYAPLRYGVGSVSGRGHGGETPGDPVSIC